jgi:hypothetical protein
VTRRRKNPEVSPGVGGIVRHRGKTAMRFIETWLPLLVLVRGRDDGADIKRLEEGFGRCFQRGRAFAVLSLNELQSPPMGVMTRQRMAEWANGPGRQHAFKQFCLGWATVAANDAERRALTALLWLWQPAAPHDAVDTVGQGVDAGLARLQEKGVPLPTSVVAFRHEVCRGLAKLPLAGLHDDVDAGGGPQRRRSGAKRVGSLEQVTRGEGHFMMGWLRPGVLWVSFHGHVSAELADLYARRLERLLRNQAGVLYFGDASGIDSADLLARNRVLGTLSENRQRFSGIRILNWSGGVSSTGQALLAGLQGLVVVAEDHDHFQRMLSVAAPGGRALIAACAAAGSTRSSGPRTA